MSLSRFNNHNLFGFDDFPRFGLTMRDPFDDLMMPVVPNFARTNDMILRHSSPGYEINETDDKYQIAVDVPGIKAGDMKVNVENEGRVLHIAGGRKVVRDGSTSETKFDKRFTIGKNVDIDKMTANLSDGVLVLTAPKKKEEEKPVRSIAIMEGPSEEKKEA